MIFLVVFVAAVALVNGQTSSPAQDYSFPYHGRYEPYSFSYSTHLDDGDGYISRRETSDGTGRVEGSYSLNNDEGHFRVVDYVADHNGFRAHIRTNEPGTDNKNPADVTIHSTAEHHHHDHYDRHGDHHDHDRHGGHHDHDRHGVSPSHGRNGVHPYRGKRGVRSPFYNAPIDQIAPILPQHEAPFAPVAPRQPTYRRPIPDRSYRP